MFFVCLLTFSTIFPNLAGAEQGEIVDLQAEDERVEKEREDTFFEGSDEADAVEEDELATVLSGLELETPDFEDVGVSEKIESEVADVLKESETVDVIVRLKDAEETMVEGLYVQARGLDSRSERIEFVQERLKDNAKASQQGIKQTFQRLEERGHGEVKQSYWIINGIAASVTEDGLKELQNREDVKKITLDREIELPEITVEDSEPRLPEWGLEKINAPQVWGEYGLKGDGIVVGIMDTGVEGDHEALKHNYRGRDGDHTYSWADFSGQGYGTPQDGNGHGTHVAGSAVGGGSGEPIGVAPEAEWIAAKIFNDAGSTTTSAIHAAFEWFMAPGGDPEMAPHVVNNSWGNANSYNTEFYDGVQAWVAAGIFPLFAAGNNGPGSETIGSPASFPESFAIGATDVNDQIAGFSSRGPVFWDDGDGERKRYLKPEVSAPGHEIYSAWPTARGEGAYNTISGTSMATPHVAGAIALLLQAKPELSLDEVVELLEVTARGEGHMGTLPNDLYGHGIMNIYQAVTEASFSGQLTGTLSDEEGHPLEGIVRIPAQSMEYEVGETGQFSFSVREGTYDVQVASFGYETLETEVTIVQGEEMDVAFTLEASPRHTLSGSVATIEGEPAAFAYIRVEDTPLTAVRTDQSGQFEITDLPTDDYVLHVSGEGISRKIVEVTLESDEEIDIIVHTEQTAAKRDWKTANNNLNRNAISANAIDVDRLSETWSYDDRSKGQILFSTPAVGEGKVVFVTDRGWITTLDKRTGDEVWSVRMGNTNRSSPTIEEGVVYLSGGNNGQIYALELTTGRVLWSVDVGSPAIYESPLYDNGTVYVSSGLSDDAVVTALDAESGEIRWQQPLGSPTYFGGSIGEGYLYIGSYDNRTLRALSLEDGEEVWQITLENQGFASRPVYEDGKLYVASTNFGNGQGTLHVIDAASGNAIWQNSSVGDTQAGSPIVYEDLVVIGSAAQPVVRAFDRETGDEVWVNRDVGMSLHNGAVTADGTLYITNTNGILYGLDVLTGERMYDMSLSDYSTSGIAVTSGRLIVPHRSGIYSFDAPGVLTGEITSSSGEPIEGFTLVTETGKKVEADKDGMFRLDHEPGEYTVRVGQYGYQQREETVTFISGYEEERSYELPKAGTGSVIVSAVDEQNGKALEGVNLTFKDTPVEGVSDKDGEFEVNSMYEGIYKLTGSNGGYVTYEEEVVITAGEQTEITVSLVPIDIAVLNDYESEMTTTLNVNGYTAEEREWDVIDEIEKYEILLLNGAYGSGGWQPDEELFIDLVDAAKERDVSIVFADAWGGNYGSIRQLTNYLGNPREIAHHFGTGSVRIQVDEQHPIFEGYENGDRFTVYERTGDFAWFNHYTGRHLASVGSTSQGFMGSGVAYQAVSENSAHLLLASHGAAPWISPLQGWLSPQQDIFFNGIDFLLNTEFGELTGTVENETGEPVEAQFEILETGVTFSPEEAGDLMQFNVFHDEGAYTLETRAPGYETVTQEVTFSHGEPSEFEIVLGGSDGGTITGTVVNGQTNQVNEGVEVTLTDLDEEVIEESVTGSNGRFTFSELTDEQYTLTFEKEDFFSYEETVDLNRLDGELSVKLYPVPEMAVLGDYFSSGTNFQAVFAERGVEVDHLTMNEAIDEIGNYEVIFVNEISGNPAQERLNELLKRADEYETSLVFGDTYWTQSGVNQLKERRGDPGVREQVSDTSSAAGYVVHEEHPIFNGREADEFIELLLPSQSSVTYFDEYSGYPLADIKHEDQEEAYGLGIAYKPRTANSVEVLMSGHGFSFTHHGGHYTDNAKDLLAQTMIWAAYERFNTIQGTVTDSDGEPLLASVEVVGEGFGTETNSEAGTFSIAINEGTYHIEVSAYGYDTVVQEVEVSEETEPFTIEMVVDADAASISGVIVDESNGQAIDGAHIDIINIPRETTSNENGSYELSRMMPGNYDFVIEADGYVVKELSVELSPSEEKQLQLELKPSPTVGVIVDTTSSNAVSLDEYLTDRGYLVEHFFYDETDQLNEVDVVIANSDYNNDLIPSEEVFNLFLSELDASRTPVIWTGQHGGRGSIRFLEQYEGDPNEVTGGSQAGMQGIVLDEHPLVEGLTVEETFELNARSNYYYTFDGYRGTTIADVLNRSDERVGAMVGYKGRTIDSVEILLANMTFSHSWHPGLDEFDENRETIFQNALTYALEQDEALVGELHGSLINDQELAVSGEVSVSETGQTIMTDENGEFFLGLEEGTYELTLSAYGHVNKTVSVTVDNGEQHEEAYVLQSENAGVLSGQVSADSSGDTLEGANVQVLGTPRQTTTDENGDFSLSLPEGEYNVRITAAGYSPEQLNDITVVAGEETEVTVALGNPEAIAILATSLNYNRLSEFLEGEGYELSFYDRGEYADLQESLANYALVIYNDKDLSKSDDELEAFVEAADEAETSILFPSQFGSGTIRYLVSTFGDPENVRQGFESQAINVTVEESHPIFSGYHVGDEVEILNNGTSNQQYSVYDNYSGATIGSLSHTDKGVIGEGIGYSYRTANSVHILMSGFAASTYGAPETRWTNDAKQLYLNAIDWGISASLGEIRGKVTNEEGEAVSSATVSILENNMETNTGSNGQFRFGVGEGTYTLEIRQRGFESTQLEVTVENVGDTVEVDIILKALEGATLSGQVVNNQTEDNIAGANVTLRSVAEDEIVDEMETDEKGNYQFANLWDGDYELLIVREGYAEVNETVTIEGEDVLMDIGLHPYELAVIGDLNDVLANFLADHELYVEERGWDVASDLSAYNTIVVNSNKGSEEEMVALVDAADEAAVSLIFLGTYGVAEGSIPLYKDVYGAPSLNQHGYDEGAVYLDVAIDHPIFEAFDDEVILIHSERSPFATYLGMPGEVIGQLVVDEAEKGDAISYEFRGEDHLHVFLSSFAVTNMIGPDYGWTEDGRQLFVEAIEWTMEAETEIEEPEVPSAPVWDETKRRTNERPVALTGTADPNTTVHVYEERGQNRTRLETVESDEGGRFEAILDMQNGNHFLIAVAENEVGKTENEERMQLIMTGKPQTKGDRDQIEEGKGEEVDEAS
ncbi:carboxypeptidase regulatory-like domain-containing protein [Evansella halocellulosilytica]|uniref:carboxypeptidase regulatory-like domain-containing protein n=1 Tax=Evansella halocellulosilytica TaxID=2011013 RepID=UPI0015C820CA|nr:carboxypeptidase regulatory-like domain-containing protein [Evansella halocellulosilytica]